MKPLILLLPLLLALLAGYSLGALRKRKAVSTTYGEVQPVLTALRHVLDTNPITSPHEFLLRSDEARVALADYERTVRAF